MPRNLDIPAGNDHTLVSRRQGLGRGENGSLSRMSPESIANAIAILEAIARDRGLLAGLSPELREALVRAAGQVARPSPLDKRRLHKALRRKDTLAQRRRDDLLLADTGMRAAERAERWSPPRREASRSVARLEKPRSCYICKADFVDLHVFYDSLCPPCADLNYGKRFQT